jgi:hypothetical protein
MVSGVLPRSLPAIRAAGGMLPASLGGQRATGHAETPQYLSPAQLRGFPPLKALHDHRRRPWR